MLLRVILGGFAVALNGLDNLTTYLCLRAPVTGFEVYEANPLAAWAFGAVGLEFGLVIESLITLAATAFLVYSPTLAPRVRHTLLTLLALLPGWAAMNNLAVMQALGIAWF